MVKIFSFVPLDTADGKALPLALQLLLSSMQTASQVCRIPVVAKYSGSETETIYLIYFDFFTEFWDKLHQQQSKSQIVGFNRHVFQPATCRQGNAAAFPTWRSDT